MIHTLPFLSRSLSAFRRPFLSSSGEAGEDQVPFSALTRRESLTNAKALLDFLFRLHAPFKELLGLQPPFQACELELLLSPNALPLQRLRAVRNPRLLAATLSGLLQNEIKANSTLLPQIQEVARREREEQKKHSNKISKRNKNRDGNL